MDEVQIAQDCFIQHSSQQLYRFYGVTPFTSFSRLRIPLPCQRIPRSRHLLATPSPSNIERTLWTVTELLCPPGGIAGAKSPSCERGLMRSPGERHGNGMWIWMPQIQFVYKVQKRSIIPWFRIKGQRYISILSGGKNIPTETLSIPYSLLLCHHLITPPPSKFSLLSITTRRQSGLTLRTTLVGPSTTRWRTLLPGLWAL
jgi:hypothetical protein